MDGILEVLGIICVIYLPIILLDPEETLNRIGRSIYAFRRGLAGQTLEPKDKESQPDVARD